MKALTITAVLAITTVCELNASVTYTFSENQSGVQLSYAGSLNTSGFAFQGGLSSSAPYSYIDILGVSVPGQQLYDFQNFQSSSLNPDLAAVSYRFSADNISFAWNLAPTSRHYDTPSGYGDSFGFYIFGQSGSYATWMNLPYGYVSGSTINGGMLFEGETLASMGLTENESFHVFLPGNESIAGVVIVPEPQPMAFCVVAALVALQWRRKRI
jgi:hypothetical protein